VASRRSTLDIRPNRSRAGSGRVSPASGSTSLFQTRRENPSEASCPLHDGKHNLGGARPRVEPAPVCPPPIPAPGSAPDTAWQHTPHGKAMFRPAPMRSLPACHRRQCQLARHRRVQRRGGAAAGVAFGRPTVRNASSAASSRSRFCTPRRGSRSRRARATCCGPAWPGAPPGAPRSPGLSSLALSSSACAWSSPRTGSAARSPTSHSVSGRARRGHRHLPARWFAHHLPVIHVPLVVAAVWMHARNIRHG
jgi:hypothetical protein